MSNQVVFGTYALENPVPIVENPVICYPGRSLFGDASFGVNKKTLSKHILLLGGSGCGKTNVFLFALDHLRRSMTSQDIAIIFDTKGEFYDLFGRPGDHVIGNSMRFRSESCTWNIFGEVLADGWDDDAVSMNARELAAALFHDRGSESQPFFCNAARDIFRGILLHFVRQAKKDPQQWMQKLNNENLIAAFNSYKVTDYGKIFNYYPDFRSMLSYIGDGKSNQALGVFGELNSMLSEYFVGILAKHNPEKSISMRNAVRRKGGKAIFVEYDLSVGETLTPVYRLLIDQALKEALGRTLPSETAYQFGSQLKVEADRNPQVGSVFFFADEFKLLPNLQHIDDALNFGRGLGVKLMAGLQSIDQLYDIYGKEKGAVIASGFGSIFAFHTNDNSSRSYITERFGSNYMAFDYTNFQKNTITSGEREGHTVEEWDQINLGLGQAFIGLGDSPPFLFQFGEYGKKG